MLGLSIVKYEKETFNYVNFYWNYVPIHVLYLQSAIEFYN